MGPLLCMYSYCEVERAQLPYVYIYIRECLWTLVACAAGPTWQPALFRVLVSGGIPVAQLWPFLIPVSRVDSPSRTGTEHPDPWTGRDPAYRACCAGQSESDALEFKIAHVRASK